MLGCGPIQTVPASLIKGNKHRSHFSILVRTSTVKWMDLNQPNPSTRRSTTHILAKNPPAKQNPPMGRRSLGERGARTPRRPRAQHHLHANELARPATPDGARRRIWRGPVWAPGVCVSLMPMNEPAALVGFLPRSRRSVASCVFWVAFALVDFMDRPMNGLLADVVGKFRGAPGSFWPLRLYCLAGAHALGGAGAGWF